MIWADSFEIKLSDKVTYAGFSHLSFNFWNYAWLNFMKLICGPFKHNNTGESGIELSSRENQSAIEMYKEDN